MEACLGVVESGGATAKQQPTVESKRRGSTGEGEGEN